jgi:diguanylate cyclase (GGDEF)-like protein
MSNTANDKVDAIRTEFINSLPARSSKIQSIASKLLEQPWDQQRAKDLIYEVHNLRGFSGSHGLMKINEFAGKAEDIIEALRRKNTALTPEDRVSLQTALDSLNTRMSNVHEELKHNFAKYQDPIKVMSTSPLVMIVDDDHAFCETMAVQLESLGYRTKYIYDLEDLEQSIHTYDPKAIFMDIIFKNGETAGTKIISELREKEEIKCPVIYMSARDDINARLAAVRSGGSAFLNKSFGLSDLKNTLDVILPLQRNSSYKVLIIDDDKSMNAYCTAILESANIKVSCLESPGNVFEYIINFDPDVILLDMYMPNINGLEMACVIRQHQAFSSIPIVIMSGETDINKQFIMRSVGADDFILKPFKPHHLIDTVLNRIQRSRQTKKMIYTDGLTGLMLFPKIKDQILNLMDSCIRYSLDFSIALIDLDFFKQVNDKYGHLVGDQILREFADFLTTRVRRSDIVTRYGGEEFAVIFPYTSGENAILALNSIRDAFAKRVQHVSDFEFQVTFSAGVATIDQYQELEELLSAADQALYRAKESGRNTIDLAS